MLSAAARGCVSDRQLIKDMRFFKLLGKACFKEIIKKQILDVDVVYLIR